MRWIRWLLLGLYLVLVLLLAGYAISIPLTTDDGWIYPGIVGFLLLSQLLFIVLPGRPEYLMPIEPRRLLVPVLIAATMMLILTLGLLLSLCELLDNRKRSLEFVVMDAAVGVSLAVWIPIVCASWRRTVRFARSRLVSLLLAALMLSLSISGLSLGLTFLVAAGPKLWRDLLLIAVPFWGIWAVFFYVYTRRLERFAAVRRLVKWILGGSLMQLLATVPSHFVVIRRPGCFVGGMTFCGLMAGLYVMTWAFGPGIALLFWAEIRRRTRGRCPACGYDLRGLSQMRCPECGRPFTFDEVHATAEELEYAGQ